MAGVDVGGGDGKRQVNSDVNMIPFIDLLLVTISFLLITAVWVTYSRMNANAQIPGPPRPDTQVDPQTPEKVLHLHINEGDFALIWKQGATVVSETKVEKPDMTDKPVIQYVELATKIEAEWKAHGAHSDKADRKLDQAVLHADNRLKFKEVIAVLDALYGTQREFAPKKGKTKKVPAFNMSFSVR